MKQIVEILDQFQSRVSGYEQRLSLATGRIATAHASLLHRRTLESSKVNKYVCVCACVGVFVCILRVSTCVGVYVLIKETKCALCVLCNIYFWCYHIPLCFFTQHVVLLGSAGGSQ